MHPQIYWANSMFSDADRIFNAHCAEALRGAGYQVFLPQDAAVNNTSSESAPDAGSVFRSDTSAILDADLLVACIDQETIDSGVACEIGIAHAHGIPVVGLYTDIRQRRLGIGRMYKNLYVLGAIESVGEVVSTVEELLQVVGKHLHRHQPVESAGAVTQFHFNGVARLYSDFVERLESWYAPSWRTGQYVERFLRSVDPIRIMEFGCGAGGIGGDICTKHPGVYYLGYDNSSAMVETARAKGQSGALFTSIWSEVEEAAREQPFDAAIVLFSLHDTPDPLRRFSLIANCISRGGTVLLMDLSSWDLPVLTRLLAKGLSRPLGLPDSRLDASRLSELADASGCTILDCQIAMPHVNFPSAADLGEYLNIFGIIKGMDLPLGLKGDHLPEVGRLTEEILGAQTYPFKDQRAFIACTLKKI